MRIRKSGYSTLLAGKPRYGSNRKCQQVWIVPGRPEHSALKCISAWVLSWRVVYFHFFFQICALVVRWVGQRCLPLCVRLILRR
jgi:hypothetical protein